MTPEAPSDPPARSLKVAGGHATYTDVGEGPVLVAVHGLPGSVRDYRWLGAAVEGRLRFVRIDLPASGGTPRATMASPRLEDRAGVLLAVLDALEVEHAAVVGHSVGGLVALSAAAQWPERFRRLALLASVGRHIHRGFRRLRAPETMARLLDTPLLGHAFLPIYLRGMHKAGFRGAYERVELAHMNACLAAVSFSANRENIGRLSVPTMVCWAEDDPVIETSVSLDLAAAVPDGPRLSWATGGHNIQKSRATEIGDELVRWLTR